jgi:transcriptional regulator with XRE-family HTH domain
MPVRYAHAYSTLIERLRTARREAGLTQQRVARTLGRPQSFVSKCESGERRVDAVELAQFADLYGRSLDYFVGRTPGGAQLAAESGATGRRRKTARRPTAAKRKRR